MMIDTNIRVRWLIRRDIPKVVDIEFDSFEYPWTEEDFTDAMRKRNVIGLCAVEDQGEDDVVQGYVIYELHKKSLEILNIAVDPSLRRQGIGRAMIDKIKDKLNPNTRNFIKTIAWERNLQAHLFLKSMGFLAKKVEREHFEQGDGYLFVFIPEKKVSG